MRKTIVMLLMGALFVLALPAAAQEAFPESVTDGIIISQFDDMTRPGTLRFEQVLEALDEVGQPYILVDLDLRDQAEAAALADDLNALAVLDGFQSRDGSLKMRLTWSTRAAQLLLGDTSAVASDILEETLSLPSDFPATYVGDYLRGNVLYTLGDDENALFNLELSYNSLPRGRELESEALQLFVTYGILLNTFSEYRQTLEVIDFAIEMDPSYAYAYFVKARALRFLDRFEEAYENINQALALSDRAIYHNELGRLFIVTEQYADAEDSYNTALEISPGNAIALAGLGDVAYFSGDIEGSIPYFVDAGAADPTYAYAFYSLAYSYFDLDDLDSALSSVEEALAIDPEYTDAILLRADVLYAQGNTRAAVTEYERYLELGGQPMDYITQRLSQ